MYNRGATMGEKASKESKVTTTTQTAEPLTMSTKNALRTETPHLSRSKGIAVILIEFRID